jgi:uncharacterized membrane protein
MKKIIDKIKHWPKKYWNKFAHAGLFVAIILTAYSLTPSLLPRSPIYQGLLSGVVFAFGYGIGCFLLWVWHYLELPGLKGKWQKYTHWAFVLIGLGALIYTIANWVKWQNSILEVMHQELISTNFVSFSVIFVGIIVAMLLIAIGRLILKGIHFVMKKIHGWMPRRISNFIGFVLALVILWGITDGILIEKVYDMVDSASAQVNNLTDDGITQPTDPNKTGGSNSLISWNTLGRMGRTFIASGPSAQDIKNFTGKDAMEPIRVYVGMESKDTPEERAQLALEELKRQNAFDRKILVITTPTGTGWMDEYSMDTLEYIHGGNTANVGIQYSYLSSQATLVFHPMRAIETSTVMFDTIYEYWKTLPHDARPKVYLFGVSLGSYGGERSVQLHRIMEDPINGAFWAGPPFVNRLHKDIVAHRNPGSPVWLPTYEDGSFVRFTALENNLNNFQKDWGKMRIIYLQHASDPMTAFSPDLLFKKPEWIIGQRGPDVSPMLSWHPVVTFFQIAFDLIVSVSAAPLGYGHNFSPVSYIDGWVNISDPVDWNDEMTERLKEKFLAQ